MYDARHADGGYVTATNTDKRMIRARLVCTQATEVEKRPFRLEKVRIDSGLVSWRTTSVINHGSHQRVHKLTSLPHPRGRLEPVVGVSEIETSHSAKRRTRFPRVNRDVVFRVTRHGSCCCLCKSTGGIARYGGRHIHTLCER
jgi:hypothetical protein